MAVFQYMVCHVNNTIWTWNDKLMCAPRQTTEVELGKYT